MLLTSDLLTPERRVVNPCLCSDLKPRGVVVNMIPGLAAYIIYMCIRHSDYLNDGTKLKSLMNGVITGVKAVIKVRRPTACYLLTTHRTAWAVRIMGTQGRFSLFQPSPLSVFTVLSLHKQKAC